MTTSAQKRRKRGLKTIRKRKRQNDQARAASGFGPVTVTNIKTGEVNVWQPYTPKQVATMEHGATKRPRRKRAKR